MSQLDPPDPVFTFRGRMGHIHCMYVKHDNNYEFLYIGTNEGKVHVWDLKVKREKIQHRVGSEACLSILHNNDTFITQQRGESIKFWKENNYYWKLERIFSHEYLGFCKIGLIGEYLILPDFDSRMKLFNKVINKEIDIKPLETNLGSIMCIKCLIRFNYILTVFDSGHIYLWDLKQNVIKTSKISEDCPMAMDYNENTDEGILGSSSDLLLKFKINIENDDNIVVVAKSNLTNPGVSSVVIRSDGKLCATGCWDGRIRYFSMRTLKLLCVLCHHEGSIEALTFSNTLGELIVGGKDGRVSVWDLYTDK